MVQSSSNQLLPPFWENKVNSISANPLLECTIPFNWCVSLFEFLIFISLYKFSQYCFIKLIRMVAGWFLAFSGWGSQLRLQMFNKI